MNKIATILLCILCFACNKTNSDNPEDENNNNNNEIGSGQPGVVGTAGVTTWDLLADAEKNRIKGWNTLFLHQSVGQDLEEGCKANGFAWEYYGNGDKVNKGLMGGIFVDVGNIANGNPYEKIRVFKEQILNSKEEVKIGVFKFGYADIDDENYSQVETAYKKMVEELKSGINGFRMVHVTPPLVFSVEPYDGNGARMKVGQWMKTTFAGNDVIFDLQALESNDGACQINGVWHICAENRNSASDPSDVNGVDTSPGQGHIGKKAGQRIAKALLMSMYNSGK
ncbi:MAG: hypothetical protein IPG18_08795 [Saprospiraceae bacterium]|nr:hypothetical protein [Saprospiraceae bacterium]MBK7525924.1 hypothetical protein [Saprospiraceae bacterium]MBK8080149.1 hypothetical protein [Saprospiraceae bacterium]MBK8854062.1 hypothetical protein [Saprospiraceae bacterium]MBK9042997.1 hypothetical protein [Saprospiraceae bacterium]